MMGLLKPIMLWTHEELIAEVERLQAEINEWRHRAVGGTCRILSKGDECDCSLCVRDAEIERLRASNSELVASAKEEWWVRCREAIKTAEAAGGSDDKL